MTRPDSPDRVPLPSAAVVACYALGAALLAAAAPLLAYAGSLALFGAPHALAELRYVDGRFGGRLRHGHGAFVVPILVILAAVVALRSLSLSGRIEPADEYVVELGLVAVLAFVVVPNLWTRPARAALAIGVGAAIATGSAVAPWTTVVMLAILHNATPVGFLAERLADTPQRTRAMRTCALLFIAVPALIATGAPTRAMTSLGLYRPDAAFASAVPLAAHLRVFVPTALLDTSLAPSLFAASAYLQLLHYGIVLGVLPRLLGERGTAANGPVVPWPRAVVLAMAIAAVGVVALVGFVHDFAGTRAAYGLLASVHAWIEIPVLLLALTPRADSLDATAQATTTAID